MLRPYQTTLYDFSQLNFSIKMNKKTWLALFPLVNLILSIPVILPYLVGSNIGVGLIYNSLDNKWIVVRAMALLLISVGSLVLLIQKNTLTKISSKNSSRKIILPLILGYLLGCFIFYGHSCCDTPVSIYFGFPQSWLVGIAPDWHFLPEPTGTYLVHHIFEIKWRIDIYNLLLNGFFWANSGLLISMIKNESVTKITMPVKTD